MKKLIEFANTKEILDKYGFSMQKKFGQNFLINESVLDGIIESAGITEKDLVLEIGPGIGTMTQAMCEHAGKVVSVEIDKKLIPILEETLADFDNVTVVNDDILKVDKARLERILSGEEAPSSNIYSDTPAEGLTLKVVANLPYYITTPILMYLFESDLPFESITIMVQKEVADRMQEGPGSKEYGALSLAVQYYAKPQTKLIVPGSSFVPRPNVDSAVIKLARYETPPVEVEDPVKMFKFIRASFNQRRKTLVNGLTHMSELGLTREQVEEALRKMEKSPTVRGETFTLEEFAKLSNLL
ncbi:MAG: 16S rRNA (adenine(1518)-N(6)/adenine(1519)-N(6))-dimethyltransferase RsmA [Lachnospiraceae bacterium]|nr:16S rRNA (adenine(1518)-N(6)/adenine(1519)-N(6))-dimethyltransferase RsmA [Lachnospiraceae bacterium]